MDQLCSLLRLVAFELVEVGSAQLYSGLPWALLGLGYRGSAWLDPIMVDVDCSLMVGS